MGFEKNYLEIDLSTDSTFDVVLEAEYNIVYVKGTAGGNVAIGVDGSSVPRKGMEVRFIFDGDMDGNTLTVFGANVTSVSTDIKTVYDLFYNGTSWIHIYNPSTNTAYLTNAQVAGGAAISFDKLATVTANRAIESTAGGELTASSTTTADLAKLSAITVSAADLNRVGGTTALTADLDILTGADAAGLTPTELQRLIGVTSNIQTQLNAKANTADFSGILEIKQFSVTIPSAQVLTLNSAPVTLVPAQGAGLKIKPLAIWGQMTYNTTPYDTNGILQIFAGGTADIATANANAFLFGTTSREVNISGLNASLVTETQYIGNAPLTVTVDSSDPLNGDSDITISGLYIVTT